MNALERAAHMLLELYHRAARIRQIKGRSFRLPLTLQLIGDALALSPEHVSRTFGTLQTAGLVVKDGDLISLMNPTRLAELCDFDPAYLHDGHDAPGASAGMVERLLRAAA